MNEFKTIKQLADELGVEKHIIKYQVKKLSGDYLDNRSGIIYINSQGIALIKGILGGDKSDKILENDLDKSDKDYLVNFLLKEVEDKNSQIENFQKLLETQQKLLDQQQILTLQANKKIEELEMKSEEKETEQEEKKVATNRESEKKSWASFWKKLFRKEK